MDSRQISKDNVLRTIESASEAGEIASGIPDGVGKEDRRGVGLKPPRVDGARTKGALGGRLSGDVLSGTVGRLLGCI